MTEFGSRQSYRDVSELQDRSPDTETRGKTFLRGTLGQLPMSARLSLSWLALMVLLALFANLLTPYSHTALNLMDRLSPPMPFAGSNPAFILGTDELGRDVLSRVFVAIRSSLLIAFAATTISATIGVILGFLSAHFRGFVDGVVMALVDAQASLPFIVLSIAIIAFVGNSTVFFAMLLGLYGWERIARITRGMTLAAKEQGYATAVVDLGASPFRVYFRHILPNIMSTVVVAMTLNFPEVILLESGLSFLGLGVQPPDASLGNLIGLGREYIQVAPWLMLIPSAVIVLTTLSVSLMGDWLRDHLDPTLK